MDDHRTSVGTATASVACRRLAQQRRVESNATFYKRVDIFVSLSFNDANLFSQKYKWENANGVYLRGPIEWDGFANVGG